MKVFRAQFALVLLLGTISLPAFDDLALLTDEFDSSQSLSNWKRVFETEGWGNDPLASMNVDPSGHLVMVPHTSSWYREWRGELTFKEITGDFVVTTDVTPRSRDLSGPPSSEYSLAGIMVRMPRLMTSPEQWTPNGQNYIFLSLGAADQPGAYQFEVKTTFNSDSVLHISPGVPRARIQVARIGPHLITLRQPEGGEWSVHRRYHRPDMPPTLQAGLTVYTDWNRCGDVGYSFHNTHVLTNGTPLPGGGLLAGCNPDLNASFDFVRFQRPSIPEALLGADLSNPSFVSDAQLLAFLGSNSNTPGGASIPPRLTSVLDQTGQPVLKMELQQDRSYRLQVTDDFLSWMTIDTFVPASSTRQHAIEPASAYGFYRIVSP